MSEFIPPEPGADGWYGPKSYRYVNGKLQALYVRKSETDWRDVAIKQAPDGSGLAPAALIDRRNAPLARVATINDRTDYEHR
jgi:hypothetical protein